MNCLKKNISDDDDDNNTPKKEAPNDGKPKMKNSIFRRLSGKIRTSQRASSSNENVVNEKEHQKAISLEMEPQSSSGQVGTSSTSVVPTAPTTEASHLVNSPSSASVSTSTSLATATAPRVPSAIAPAAPAATAPQVPTDLMGVSTMTPALTTNAITVHPTSTAPNASVSSITAPASTTHSITVHPTSTTFHAPSSMNAPAIAKQPSSDPSITAANQSSSDVKFRASASVSTHEVAISPARLSTNENDPIISMTPTVEGGAERHDEGERDDQVPTGLDAKAEGDGDVIKDLVEGERKEIMRLDVVFVCDTTGSMGTSVQSLALTIKQLQSIIRLLFPENRARVGVVSYKDHNLGPICIQSIPFNAEEAELLRFVESLRPTGNWDTPEATKSGLHEAIRLIRESICKDGDISQTIIIHYTDTCPHHDQSHSHAENKGAAQRKLSEEIPGYDWVAICNYFAKKGIPVYTFLTSKDDSLAKICHSLLGPLVILNDTSTYNITKATVGLLLHLLGEDFPNNGDFDLTEVNDRANLLALPNETMRGGFPSANRVQFAKKPFQFERLESITHLFNVQDLLRQFDNDEIFVDTVFKELNSLFTPENVMALTYNVILGKLWRLCCRRRTDDRLESLRDKLMRTVERLHPLSHKTQLKSWLENSYKSTDEITATVESTHRQTPALYRDLAAIAIKHVSNDTLRSLTRAPSATTVAAWNTLLTQLHVYEGPVKKLPRDDDDVPLYLPLSLSDQDIFANLPHLFSAGMKFTLRGAILLAALCHLTDNKHLAGRARQFFVEQKGKFLPLDKVDQYPEMLADEFVRIMYKIRDFLQENEAEVFVLLYRVSRVRRASRMDYEGYFSVRPSVKNLWPDYKILCQICGFKRSFTLTNDEDVCGTCQSMRENPQEFGTYVPKDGTAPDNASHMATCRSCNVVYAVVVVDDLKSAPKCHYCRVAKKPPVYVECTVCSNRFMNPGDIKKRLGLSAEDPWTCFLCQQEPQRAKEKITFQLFEMAKENRKIMGNLGFHDSAIDIIYSTPGIKNLRLYQDKDKWSVLKKPVENGDGGKCHSIVFNGRKCLNSAEVIEKVVADVTTGELTGVCGFCFDEKDIRALMSPCGKCLNKACGDCLKEWYGNLQPGKLVLTTYLACAFCKQMPARTTIERFNPAAKALVRGEHLGKIMDRLDPNMYYGWCKGCSKVREIADKSCGAEVMPFTESANFLCDICLSSQIKLENVPKCPGCNAATVKAYGCNHIECPRCQTHWCYVCGEQFERADIYDHLIDVHGSIGIEDVPAAELAAAAALGLDPIHQLPEDDVDENEEMVGAVGGEERL